MSYHLWSPRHAAAPSPKVARRGSNLQRVLYATNSAPAHVISRSWQRFLKRLGSRSQPPPTAGAGTAERKPRQNQCGGLLVYFGLAHASLDFGLSPPLLTAVTW